MKWTEDHNRKCAEYHAKAKMLNYDKRLGESIEEYSEDNDLDPRLADRSLINYMALTVETGFQRQAGVNPKYYKAI